MLDLILKILGIILLALILLLLAVVLLVLFFPVTYRIRGRKTAEKMELSAGANWFFGLLRVRCLYPEPGTLTAKFLWFKLYHTKLPPDGKAEPEKAASGKGKAAELSSGRGSKPHVESKKDTEETISGEPAGRQEREEEYTGQEESRPEGEAGQEGSRSEGEAGQKGSRPEGEAGQKGSRPEDEAGQEESRPEGEAGQKGSRPEDEAGQEEPCGGFFKKFQKIKYTIFSIYDKIKEIWKNISYYTALLQEENTRQLWAYVKLRAAKILKNIRPRHIRADILFGTGSPDTTGYAFGMYCMLSPILGARAVVTPDFERAVLEGRLDISGRITVFVLVVNIVRLMMDKKLQAFIKKLKKGAPQKDRASHKQPG